MSSKVKKISIIVASILVLSCAVAGSLAWLTASQTVTNTFTVGNIDLTLTEPNYDKALDHKLYPGAEIAKDPTITVKGNSENCYVYAMVENNLTTTVAGKPIACNPNINTADWGSGTPIPGTNKIVYCYKTTVTLKATDQVLPTLFTTVSVPTSFGKTEMVALNNLGNKTIRVAAYAHQAEKLTQAEAEAAAIAYLKGI